MLEALRRDLVAVAPLPAPLQRGVEGVAVDRLYPDLSQDAAGVAHRRRLDQSRGDELEERLIIDHVKPELLPPHFEDVQKVATTPVLHRQHTR